MIPLESRPPNVEGQGRVTIRDLVRNSLRMRPDRIIVGEVRGAEAFDMIQAMNTGHEGSLTTVHANDAFDALAANCNGILRGLGRQEIGGYVGLFAYYLVGMPISFGTGFGLGWGLYGLWVGPAVALGVVAAIEGFFITRTSWEGAVEMAKVRNAAN